MVTPNLISKILEIFENQEVCKNGNPWTVQGMKFNLSFKETEFIFIGKNFHVKLTAKISLEYSSIQLEDAHLF